MKQVLLLALIAGCSGETTARLTIKPASMQPRSLRLFLWGDGLLRPPTDLPLGTHQLPGTLILRHLDAHTPDFRLLVEGLDDTGVVASEAGSHLPLIDGQENDTVLQLLDGKLADSDGDQIPDVVDDCPSVPDPDQRCAAPPVADLTAPGIDLKGVDFAAAMPDLSPDLSSSDLAQSAACPPFAIFCDDFESGNFSKWGTRHDEGGGSTISVDSTQKWSGNFAAHAVGSGGVVYQPVAIAPAVSSGMIGFRTYFFTPTVLVPHIYFYFLHRAGADSDYVLGWDNFAGPDQWTLFNKNPGNDSLLNASAAPGVWHCIEMDVTLTGSGNRIDLYFDNGTAQTVNVPSSQAAPFLDEFAIGVTYQNVSTGNEWYFDDVVLAKQHIGCE